jgi:methionyl-tRNA formyltransferase
MDGGPVVFRLPLSLEGSLAAIWERIQALVPMAIEALLAVPWAAVPQDPPREPPRLRRTPAQSEIGPHAMGGPAKVYDVIRMLDMDGYPRAFLRYGPLRLTFSDAALSDDVLTAQVRITWDR